MHHKKTIAVYPLTEVTNTTLSTEPHASLKRDKPDEAAAPQLSPSRVIRRKIEAAPQINQASRIIFKVSDEVTVFIDDITTSEMKGGQAKTIMTCHIIETNSATKLNTINKGILKEFKSQRHAEIEMRIGAHLAQDPTNSLLHPIKLIEYNGKHYILYRKMIGDLCQLRKRTLELQRHITQTEDILHLPFGALSYIQLLTELVNSIQQIHALNIIHCDLKPENITVYKADDTKTYHFKIIDFGLAQRPNTHSPKMIGSNLYQAPDIIDEITQGKPATYSHHTDYFQLGEVCWFLLTGDRFVDTSIKTIIDAYDITQETKKAIKDTLKSLITAFNNVNERTDLVKEEKKKQLLTLLSQIKKHLFTSLESQAYKRTYFGFLLHATLIILLNPNPSKRKVKLFLAQLAILKQSITRSLIDRLKLSPIRAEKWIPNTTNDHIRSIYDDSDDESDDGSDDGE